MVRESPTNPPTKQDCKTEHVKDKFYIIYACRMGLYKASHVQSSCLVSWIEKGKKKTKKAKAGKAKPFFGRTEAGKATSEWGCPTVLVLVCSTFSSADFNDLKFWSSTMISSCNRRTHLWVRVHSIRPFQTENTCKLTVRAKINK